ncbi:MAG: nucleotidyltransferase family protein [Tissierellia bacterium]|nr:nucleotidyltransferase family protein [Tissierellia bacterium]
MKTLAIISEFNPFHNGHKYLLKTAKKLSNCNIAISLMSGNVVQRGEFSFVEKFTRANIAINEGFDLILEMPSFITLQSAENFAYYNIKLMKKLKIDAISFGIENLSTEEFINKTNYLLDHQEEFNKIVKSLLLKGNSYTKSSLKAIEKLIGKNYITSNNILGFEYIKAVNKLNYNLEIIPIRREKSLNNERELLEENFASSSAIRNNFDRKEIKTYMPKYSYESTKKALLQDQQRKISNTDIMSILKYKLAIEKKTMNEIIGYENGIENYLQSKIIRSSNLNSFIENVTTTRYTKSRIKRLLLNYIIGNKIYLNKIDINFCNILAFNKNSLSFLKERKNNILFLNSKKEYDNLENDQKTAYKSIIDTSNLYYFNDLKLKDYDFKIIRKIRD